MKANQAWGWLAAGVLAAGLNANYYDGGFQLAHRVADRLERSSEAVRALASGHADPFLSGVRLLTARNETASCRLVTTMARVQAKIMASPAGLARFAGMSDRAEAQFAKFQANRGRMEAQNAVQTVRLRIAPVAFAPLAFRAIPAPVVCPRVRLNIPQMPAMKISPIPVIHIDTASSGPV